LNSLSLNSKNINSEKKNLWKYHWNY
jgi:hypothetical protein